MKYDKKYGWNPIMSTDCPIMLTSQIIFSLKEILAQKFLICPFDPVHCIEPPKMPFHLTKCTKNKTKNKFLRCPFNGTHMIDEKMMIVRQNNQSPLKIYIKL